MRALSLASPSLTASPQVFDDFLRKRADKLGANLVNGLYMGMEVNADESITVRYNKYSEGERVGGAALGAQCR